MGNDEMMLYDIWLQCVLGHGNARGISAIEYFGSSQKVYESSTQQKKNSGIFTHKDLSRFEKVKISEAQRILESCKKHSVTPISVSSDAFPQSLRATKNCPLVLYYRGTLPDLNTEPIIAIVGPRRVSEFGAKSAFALAKRLSAGGFTVVSGIAHGADSKAHLGAIDVGRPSICVLPHGHDYNYLPEQKALREKIEKLGCTLSEKPPMSPLGAAAFHIRNRLISGLGLGVILVEAGKRSGGLITANHALEQGRDVFVIPGNPTDKHYEGSNALLRDGANVLLSAMDIFGEYSAQFPDKVSSEAAYKKCGEAAPQKIEKIIASALSKTAKMVYNNMNVQVFSLDDVFVEGVSTSEMISALTELEILGLIETLPGGRYLKK